MDFSSRSFCPRISADWPMPSERERSAMRRRSEIMRSNTFTWTSST